MNSTPINEFSSHHTDSIISRDEQAAKRFLREVDSASIGISTGKMHPRGPVGLDGLVTYKYVLSGNGQVVADYTGPESRRFIHGH